MGTRFGRLVTTSHHIYGLGNGSARVWVRCDCGKTKIVLVVSLRREGNTRSCGCLQRELQSKRARKIIRHGRTRVDSPRAGEYASWSALIGRCENPRNRQYQNYGGRGIRVCERWRHNFLAFIEDMGPRPSPRHSLDRINNDGDYCHENCRWATARDQVNNRRVTVFLTVNGERLPLSVWAKRLGLNRATLAGRIKRGMTHERACTAALMKDPTWISPRRLHPIRESRASGG